MDYRTTMKSKKLPCKNCISLPMCISIYKKWETINITLKNQSVYTRNDEYWFLKDLKQKCTLIDEYVRGDNSYFVIITNFNIMMTYFSKILKTDKQETEMERLNH